MFTSQEFESKRSVQHIREFCNKFMDQKWWGTSYLINPFMMGLKAPWIMEFPKEKYIKTQTPQSCGKDKLINFQYLSHIHNNIYDACAGWQTISKIQADCTAAMKVKFLTRSTTQLSLSEIVTGVGLPPIECLSGCSPNNTNVSTIWWPFQLVMTSEQHVSRLHPSSKRKQTLYSVPLNYCCHIDWSINPLMPSWCSELTKRRHMGIFS